MVSHVKSTKKKKGKATPVQAYTGTEGTAGGCSPQDFHRLGTGRHYPPPSPPGPGKIPAIHSCQRLSRPQGQTAGGRIK